MQGGGPGGFDKMQLYSLYEDDIARKQIQYEYGIHKDSFRYHHLSPQPDHFMVSDGITREANMHMVMRQQQQQQQVYMTNQMQQQLYMTDQMQQPYQQQYENQYRNQYQQWYQQQNMLTTYNRQQSSNKYLQRQMSNPQMNLYANGISYSHN